MSTIQFKLDSDGVALLSIDVPERSMNVVTPVLAADLKAAVEQVIARDDIKGAVITSAKNGSFVAGADLMDFATVYDSGTLQQARDWIRDLVCTLRRMETGGKPFAAAINGLALGGGLELCLACHYRVLVDNPKAVVGLPEVTVGLLPGGGGTQRLPRLIGIEKALPMLLSGQHVKPGDALKLGMVDRVAPADQVVEIARRWVIENPAAVQPWDVKGFKVPGGAGPLAAHATRSFSIGAAQIRKSPGDNYPAPMAILSSVYEGTQTQIDVGLRIEAKYFAQLLGGPVARNLMRTMFVNKGIADKLGRRPRDVPKSAVNKLGVVGAGMMGAGIAYAAAAVGIEVVLLDATLDQAVKGKSYSATLLNKDIDKGRATPEKAQALLARIAPTASYADLDGCDMVIEAVFENRAVKADVTAKCGEVLAPAAVFATNTSTLPITSLAQNYARPEQFIGLHFFSPVERMPLVEVILGSRTSQSTLARALDLVGQLRKTPIVVNDSPGFFTSRVFCTYIDEGMAMLREGINPALIENAARMGGMATGPLAVADEVSLDLQKKVVDQAVADGLPEKFLRGHAQEVIDRFNQLGRLGRKTGGGFYEFPKDAKKHLWPGLKELFPLKAGQPEVREVMNRLMYIQALEAARCVEEGVITDPMDADLGSIMGIGFPSWTGGVLSFIETVGLQAFVDECRRLAQCHGKRFEPSPWLTERAARGAGFY